MCFFRELSKNYKDNLLRKYLWGTAFAFSGSQVFVIKLEVPEMMLETFARIFMTSGEFTVAEIADTKYGLTFDHLDGIVIESSQDHKFIGKSVIKGCQQSQFCNNSQVLFLSGKLFSFNTPWKHQSFLYFQEK